MDIKRVFVALLWACGFAQAAPMFGIVKLDGNGHAYLVTPLPLEKWQDVRIQFPDKHGKPVCCKNLPAKMFKPLTDDRVLATNELADESPQIYWAEMRKGSDDVPFVGLAAVGKKMKTRNTQQGLEVQENGGSLHAATACFSNEGMHLIERVRESEHTHLYLSLGYDVERPTCPESIQSWPR